jgi:catechol 2,3-dioxygenase-like lactoylglutathione lyase family enzyme
MPPDAVVSGRVHDYAEPFFHLGVVCRDLDATRAHLAERFGITFHEPEVFDLPHVDDGAARSVSLRACFSTLGPPHLELFQADDAGIYRCDGEAAVHHVGLWIPDCRASLARAHEAGLHPAAVLSDDAGNPQYWFTDPAESGGIRFEMIDDGDRANLETFIRTGRYPTAPT